MTQYEKVIILLLTRTENMIRPKLTRRRITARPREILSIETDLLRTEVFLAVDRFSPMVAYR